MTEAKKPSSRKRAGKPPAQPTPPMQEKTAEMRGEATAKVADPIVEDLKKEKPEPKEPRKVATPAPEPVEEVTPAPKPQVLHVANTKMGRMKARKRARG